MSKTKIVVLQMKEIAYTGIFVALGILLIILLVVMFLPGKEENADVSDADAVYQPGIYTTELTINNTKLQLEVAVDASHINSVSLTNVDETVKTMFPLMEPTVDAIEEQLANGTSIDDIAPSEENQYTQEILLGAVKNALNEAKK